MTPNDLMLREALIADHDDILNITKDEKLYDGKDYLQHYLKKWLEQGVDKQSNRRNLVFLLDNKVIGFTSISFQNGGTSVVFYARRIVKSMRGKGFGKKSVELTIEHLKNNYPNVTHQLTHSADQDVLGPELHQGELLTKRASLFYENKMSEITDLLVKYAASLPEPRNENQFLTKDEFKQVLQNKTFVREAFENEILILQWNAILLKTKEDIEFATMDNQNVLLEGSRENPIALSILTCPFPVADGKLRTFFNFYTCKPDDATGMSVVEHLTKHLVHFNQCNDAVEDRVTFFDIFTLPKDSKQVVQDMEIKVGVRQRFVKLIHKITKYPL